ncbi:MAG: DUF5131 family protein [Clostridiaceae bacterium]|nr:DUF5131 family protein [Clostridiaceae bacterium]
MNKTKIEWCDSTLNPVVGCTYGCEYCYARKMNNRFKWIEDFSKPQFFPERLEQLKSKKPQIIFMDSMSDIADWEDEWIIETFKAIGDNPQHRYLFLTKRIDEYMEKALKTEKIRNAMLALNPLYYFGHTIDTQIRLNKLKYDVDFYSVEPILEPIEFYNDDLAYSQWVILGAETGNRKDKVVPEKEWIDDIVEKCRINNSPIFMKDSLIPIIGEENMLREFPEGLRRSNGQH